MNLEIQYLRAGIAAALFMLGMIPASSSWALDGHRDFGRYFYSGNGKISIYSERTEKSFSGVYRKGAGNYDEKALGEICRVFGAPYKPSQKGLSLRLVEFMDYLEDRLHPGAKITLTSGYRNPEYNTMLREKGNLAAKASLHQYGMAADLKIQGVNAKVLWAYIKALKFGGAGYYHGETIHVDVGPARSWDETTSGVGTGISDDNKLIGMIMDYDVYQPGMAVTMRLIRMTAFPIGVIPEFSLFRQNPEGEFEKCLDFSPAFSIAQKEHCMDLRNIEEMDRIQWKLPGDVKPGQYKIQARFCDDAWPDMPREILTPEFEVTRF
ncbi:MAG: DUF882 domain-containing protein [Proteobacteria bacterium]|nr:DUF882 domain-containing protein [Pseudomonadota bacterium]